MTPTYPGTGQPMTAGVLADASTINHLTEHGRTIGIWENVKHYGAYGDGSHDDTVAIQATVDAIGTAGGTMLFPPGTYKVSTPGVVLPGESANDYSFRIVGYGATITATTAISMMKRANPTNYSPSAINMSRGRFHIEGLKFAGNNTTGQVGLDLVASFASQIDQCIATNCDVGFRLTFCLMTRATSCLTAANSSYGWQLRSGSGVFTGGTVDNSGCNHSVLEACRDYAGVAQPAQFHIRASGQIAMHGCIVEGNNPVRGIDYASNSSSVKGFMVRNLHIENSPTDCVARCAMDVGGLATFDRLWIQPGSLTVIDGSGMVSSTIIVRDLQWVPAGTLFKSDHSGTWVFEGPGQVYGSDYDPASSAAWVGGVLPEELQVLRRGTAGGNPTTHLTPINGVFEVGGSMVVDGTQMTIGSNFGAPVTGWHSFAQNFYKMGYANEVNPRFQIDRDSGMLWGAGGASAVDVQLIRTQANVVAFSAGDSLRHTGSVHASLPAASGYAAGSQYYCTTDKQPIWSDGSSWYEADGTVH